MFQASVNLVGSRSSWAEWGRAVLWSLRQSSMIARASRRESKCRRLKGLSLILSLNDSTLPFCQGEPGSMKHAPVLSVWHQSAIACATNLGPLSNLTKTGAPQTARRSSSTSTTSSVVME
jgi:hypothetical protein